MTTVYTKYTIIRQGYTLAAFTASKEAKGNKVRFSKDTNALYVTSTPETLND